MEEFENLKEKVLKYILYKKRTEQEIKRKFQEYSGNILDNVIEYLKEAGYINDNKYIEKSINELMILKNLSIKEITYKLLEKGVDNNIIEDYIYNNQEMLKEYELQSAKNMVNKKTNTMELEKIYMYLAKKGYSIEIIKMAIEGEK